MNEDALTDLGLSQNEAKVYLSLIELGLCSITLLADRCSLHRSNVYDSIKKLIERGLVSYIKKDSTTLYEANNPEYLLNIVKEKENRIRSIMPQLMLSKKFAQSKGEANVLEGVPGFMHVLYGFLEHKEEILAYGIPKIAPDLLKTKIPHFHVERLKLGIPMKHIYNHNAKDRIDFLNKMELTFARYLPGSFDSEVSTNVCGDQIALAVWSSPVIVIQIRNKIVADSYKRYFNLLWDAAK